MWFKVVMSPDSELFSPANNWIVFNKKNVCELNKNSNDTSLPLIFNLWIATCNVQQLSRARSFKPLHFYTRSLEVTNNLWTAHVFTIPKKVAIAELPENFCCVAFKIFKLNTRYTEGYQAALQLELGQGLIRLHGGVWVFLTGGEA